MMGSRLDCFVAFAASAGAKKKRETGKLVMELSCMVNLRGPGADRKVALIPSIETEARHKMQQEEHKHRLRTARNFTAHSNCLFQSNSNKVTTEAAFQKLRENK